MYMLSRDYDMRKGGEYGISFLRQNMMREMNVPQAFAATALCFFLYLVLMGIILYTCNLLIGGIWGIVPPPPPYRMPPVPEYRAP